jgi:hypothetical protein
VPVIIEVLANDADPDGDQLQVTSVEAPANGTSTANSDGSVTYAPASGFEGSDSFRYAVSDGRGGTHAASVTITIASPVSGDALLSRIAAAPEGSWLKVNSNRFEEVWTPVAQRAQVDGVPLGEPRKIITAWGSMAWDDNRRQLIIWGGGHANYAGNDVYRFDAATLRWQRASLPSAVHAPLGDKQYFAVDGPMNAPTSSHTYDNQEFLPLADRFITFGGAKFNAGQVFVLEDGVTRTGPYLWDPSRAGSDMVGGTTGSQVNPGIFPEVVGGHMWQNRDTIVSKGIGQLRPAWFVNGTTAYADEDGSEVIYVSESPREGGDLFRYRISRVEDPDSDIWERIGVGAKSYADQGAGAYDPLRKVYLRTARFSSSYGIVMWNTATPVPQNGVLRFIPRDGNGVAFISNLHGMDFDPVRGVFVLWNGNDEVWYLSPPAVGSAFTIDGWTAARAPVSGASRPDIQMTTGILGKWKYIRSHDVMMGLGGGNEGQVWVYKPVGWQPP